MPGFFEVMLLALLPAAGNLCGGLVAEFVETTRERLSLALHLAAGIVFSVIAIELAPRAFGGETPWIPALGFFVGGIAYVGLEWLTDRLVPGETREAKSSMGGGWVIYAAVAVDLFADGLLVGTGSAISLSLALLLAVG